MKTLFLNTLLVIGALIFCSNLYAHGSEEPKHGGKVQIEHEMVFELVKEESGTSLYLRDHGKAYPTEKLTGHLTVLASGKKLESPLVPVGTNKMTSNIVIPDGAKVLVKVKENGHHSVTVRFSF